MVFLCTVKSRAFFYIYPIVSPPSPCYFFHHHIKWLRIISECLGDELNCREGRGLRLAIIPKSRFNFKYNLRTICCYAEQTISHKRQNQNGTGKFLDTLIYNNTGFYTTRKVCVCMCVCWNVICLRLPETIPTERPAVSRSVFCYEVEDTDQECF